MMQGVGEGDGVKAHVPRTAPSGFLHQYSPICSSLAITPPLSSLQSKFSKQFVVVGAGVGAERLYSQSSGPEKDKSILHVPQESRKAQGQSRAQISAAQS